jgi:hypothetical protein
VTVRLYMLWLAVGPLGVPSSVAEKGLCCWQTRPDRSALRGHSDHRGPPTYSVGQISCTALATNANGTYFRIRFHVRHFEHRIMKSPAFLRAGWAYVAHFLHR